MKMKILAMAATLVATAMPSVSYADLAYNVGLVTDYRYRGISQTREKFALQGGLDFTAGGLYLGLWSSQIKWIKDFGGDAGLARIFREVEVGSLVPRRVVIGISPPMPTEDCRCQSVRNTNLTSGDLVGGLLRPTSVAAT